MPRQLQLELIRAHAAGNASLAARAALAKPGFEPTAADGQDGDGCDDGDDGDDGDAGAGAGVDGGGGGLVACTARAALDVLQPRLPIDLRAFPEVSPQEAVAFHVAYGATHQALRDTLVAVARAEREQLEPLVHLGLVTAAALDNPPSARELVRCTAPLLLVPTSGDAAAAAPAAPPMQPHPLVRVAADGTSFTAAAAAAANAAARAAKSLSERPGGGGAPSSSAAGMSREMLVAVGAQVMLEEFVAGSTTARLQRACSELDEWVSAAQRCSVSSLAFMLRSWHEARQAEPDSELLSFMSAKALANRRKFCEELRALQAARDGVAYCRQLREIVGALRRPCLRLRLLQMVLGLDRLDGAFSRDVVHGVVCLASDIVERMADGEGAPPDAALGLSDGGGGGGGVEYAEYDEATRLEAETSHFGAAPRRLVSSDPLGEEARLTRVSACVR